MAQPLAFVPLDPIEPTVPGQAGPPAFVPLDPIGVEDTTPAPVGFFEGLKNSVLRGGTAMDSTLAAGQFETGLIDDRTFARTIIQNLADAKNYPSSPDAQAGRDALANVPSVFSWDTLGAVASHPSVVPDIIAESLPASLPSIIGGTVGAIGGGLTAGPIGGVAGAATGAGAGSALTEYGSSIVDGLTAGGIPVTEDTIVIALNDPNVMAALRSKAGVRAAIIGAFDGISAGAAGRFMKPVEALVGKVGGGAIAQPIAGGVAETAAQAGFGMAGEAGGQIATEGKITDPGAVAAEGLGEAGSLVTDVVPAVGNRMIGEAVGNRAAAPVPAPTQGERVEPTLSPIADYVPLDPVETPAVVPLDPIQETPANVAPVEPVLSTEPAPVANAEPVPVAPVVAENPPPAPQVVPPAAPEPAAPPVVVDPAPPADNVPAAGPVGPTPTEPVLAAPPAVAPVPVEAPAQPDPVGTPPVPGPEVAPPAPPAEPAAAASVAPEPAPVAAPAPVAPASPGLEPIQAKPDLPAMKKDVDLASSVVDVTGPAGERWVGSGQALIRADNNPAAKTFANTVTKMVPGHKGKAVDYGMADRVIQSFRDKIAESGTTPVTWSGIATVDGQRLVVGTTPDGKKVTLKPGIFDTLRLAGGQIVLAGKPEPYKKTGNLENFAVAINDKGEVIGVAAPIRHDAEALAKAETGGGKATSETYAKTQTAVLEKKLNTLIRQIYKLESGVMTPTKEAQVKKARAAAQKTKAEIDALAPHLPAPKATVNPILRQTDPKLAASVKTPAPKVEAKPEAKPVETPASVPAETPKTEQVNKSPVSQDTGPKLAEVAPHLPKDKTGATDYNAIPLYASEFFGKELQWKDMTPGQRREFLDRLIADNEDINGKPSTEDANSTKLEDRNTPTFNRAATEVGDPVSELAFIDAGMNPDEANTIPPNRQAALLARLLETSFGFKKVDWRGANVRDAIDNMLNGYRNLRMMLHALGLPLDALGLRNTLTLSMIGTTRMVNGKKRAVNYFGVYDSEDKTLTIAGRANSFAHEYAHALDNFLMETIYQGPGINAFLSRFTRREGIDPLAGDVATSFARVLNAIFFDDAKLAARVLDLQKKASSVDANGNPTKTAIDAERQLQKIEDGSSELLKERSEFYKNARMFAPGSSYWTNPAEMFARAFEAYVGYKVSLVEGTNEFVSKGNDAYEETTDRRLRMTFPKAQERMAIYAAFDDLMNSLRDTSVFGSISIATAPDMAVVMDPNAYVVARAQNNRHRRLYHEMRDEVAHILASLRELSRGNFQETYNEFRDARAELTGGGSPASKRIPTLKWGARLGRYFLGSEAGMMMLRVKANARRGGNYLDAIRKQIAREPGRGDLQGDLFQRAVIAETNAAMSKITAAMEVEGVPQFVPITPFSKARKEGKASRERIRRLLTNAGAKVAGATRAEVAVAAAVRRVLDSVYRRAKAVGLNVGYVSDQGYLPRIMNDSAVFENPTKFEEQAAKVYEDQFDEIMDEAKDPIAAMKDMIRALKRKDVAGIKDPSFQALVQALNDELKAKPQDKAAVAQATEDLKDALRPIYGATEAKAYTEAILLGSPYTFDRALGPTSSFTAARTLPPSADVHLKDFYIDDPFAAAHAYITAMNRKIEYHDRFGMVGGEKWNRDYDEYVRSNPGVEEERIARRMSRLQAIQTLTDPSKANRLEMLLTEAMRAGANPEDIAGMRGHVEFMTGLGEQGVTREDSMFSNTVYTVGMLQLLGRVSYTALAEPAAVIGRAQSLKAGWKIFQTYVSLPFDRAKSADLQALGEALGIITNAYNEQATQAVMDYHQPGVSWSRIMAAYMTRNLQTPLTNAQRKAALATFDWYVRKTLAEATGPAGVDADRAKAELRELGVSEDDLVPMRDWLVSLNGALPEPGRDTDTPYGRAYGVAAREFVFSTIQEPDRSTKPRLASHRYGRLVFGLLSFAYTMARNTHLRLKNRIERDIRIYEENGASKGEARWNAINRNGWAFAGGMGAIFVAQFLTTVVREALLNSDEWKRREQEGTVWSWLTQLGFSRSGALGPLDVIYQAAMGVKYQRDLTALTAGPYLGTNLGMLQSLLNLAVNNSPKTNNTEYAAFKDLYRTVGNGLIAYGLSTIPGGPIISGLSTVGIMNLTSPGAADVFARTLVGEKDSTLTKRAREAARAEETPLERYRRERREERKRKKEEEN